MLKAFLLAVCLLAGDNCFADEDVSLPLIYEEMDSIIVVHQVNGHSNVVFIRNNAVMATRLMVDDMQWVVVDGHFQLIWQDYWTAQRVVQTDHLKVIRAIVLPDGNDGGQWWAMGKNMRDLKQP